MHGLNFTLHSAGVLGPGIRSLSELNEACASSRAPIDHTPLHLPAPSQLPANERRRTSRVVRLVLACIDQALENCPFPAVAFRSVFATDDGMGEISQQMLDILATTREVSPTLFSNSVHGAPAGYFAIASHNHQSATVVSLGLESFASGLLCAVTETIVMEQPVLFVSYDPVMMAPLDELLPISEPTATAWIISAGSAERNIPVLGTFELSLEPGLIGPSRLPAWVPARWAANSSAQGFAALGLLAGTPGTCRRMALGKQMLVVECKQAGFLS